MTELEQLEQVWNRTSDHCGGSLYHSTPDGYIYRCEQGRPARRLTGWHILGGAAVLASVAILLTLIGGTVYVVANGVGYLVAHAWWNQ